ncbi:hypothetical protein L226DRAFT_356600 [Lentinus tigrinus ALCF2SS1-7]|uniref:uncharacterized protein n=1 Tax=Lentinus tigrinus ALCF2SS1-7 TaxID=1328758 RepID=UPI001165D52A|nr:hypothetical protein L226DRAFT_356600 [Lentinus tigrinus ALCF2SS1-7]
MVVGLAQRAVANPFLQCCFAVSHVARTRDQERMDPYIQQPRSTAEATSYLRTQETIITSSEYYSVLSPIPLPVPNRYQPTLMDPDLKTRRYKMRTDAAGASVRYNTDYGAAYYQ